MPLVLIIAALWSASLLLVAALCAAARVGDDELAHETYLAEAARSRGADPKPHEPAEAPVRIAA